MKRLLGIAAAWIEVLLLIGALWIRIQERTRRRIRSKADQAIRQSAQLMRLGGDPNPVFHLISQIPPIVSVGQLAEAEALADRALTTVDAAIRALPAPSRITLPTDTRPEAASGLYFDPQPVVIEGYDGVAMASLRTGAFSSSMTPTSRKPTQTSTGPQHRTAHLPVPGRAAGCQFTLARRRPQHGRRGPFLLHHAA
jgi:hypothetical protein